MSQNISTSDATGNSKEHREEDFDAYYKKIVSMQDHLERIQIVAQKLETKYSDYEETKDFVHFLCVTEEVFAHAEEEKWSVEKTEEEMIKSEIYLLSKMSGVGEEVFQAIYSEFTQVSQDVEKIQGIAKRLLERYPSEESPDRECREFIVYVRDALLVFAHTLHGEKAFDEITEAKTQIIRLRMESMAADNKPPLNILQGIYKEFLEEIHRT
jgi:hypothetical protein